MPLTLAPLERQDYGVMGYPDHEAFFTEVNALGAEDQKYVVNATVRLADVDWLARTLDEQVRDLRGPPLAEGLLSLQRYLLLTCADALGHLSAAGGHTKRRFETFFLRLPIDTQQRLVDSFLVWRTNRDELTRLGLAAPEGGAVTSPAPKAVRRCARSLVHSERLGMVIDFLYRVRRNPFTHEAGYPQAGWHPNLSVLQMRRLGVGSVATLGEWDRFQGAVHRDVYYFVYYNGDDPIAELRRVVLEGLGDIVRSGQS